MFTTKAYAAANATSPLAATTIARRDPAERDVQIDILFCGICHSDIRKVNEAYERLLTSDVKYRFSIDMI
jgi:uncharacterized zinc-type alcohol dehydrogenase-like protein